MKTLQGSFDRRVKGPILGCLLLCALFFTGARFAPIGPFFSAAPRHGDLKIAESLAIFLFRTSSAKLILSVFIPSF